MAITREQAERWVRETQAAFAAFQDFRRNRWDPLIERKLVIEVPPELGINIIEYQTPALKRALGDVTDVLTLNPTEFDAFPLKPGPKVEKAARQVALWAARAWADQNPGRWWDIAVGEGQARYGVKVMQMLYDAKRSQPFYWEDTDTLACSWLMRGRQTPVIVCQVQIPLLRAHEEYLRLGKRPGLNDQGKLIWVGEGYNVGESIWQTNLTLTIVEYLDNGSHCPCCEDGHPLWAGIHYLSTGLFAEAEEVETYTLPYKNAPSLRVIPGRVMSSQRDPHKRYQPLLYDAFIEGLHIDHLETIMGTVMRRDVGSQRIYGDRTTTPEAIVGQLPEDAKSEQPYTLPDPAGNEMPMLWATIKAFPQPNYQPLMDLLASARRRFEAAKPNPFIMGTAFEQVAQGTGTANVLQTQQARLPFDRLLVESDAVILTALEDQLHALRYWAYAEDKDAKSEYQMTMVGTEHLRRGHIGPGETVMLSQEILDAPVQLYLETRNDTPQDVAERRRQAVEGKVNGVLTTAQFIHEWGYADEDHQMRELEKERTKRLAQPLKDQAKLQIITSLFASLADIGLVPQPAGTGPPPVGVTGNGQNVEASQPTIRLPATASAVSGPEPGPVM